VLFYQKVAEDRELLEKMQACKSPEEAYALASSVQDGFTFEEFVETMTKLYSAMNQDEELSDEDLAMAAGGGAGEFIDEHRTSISIVGTIVSVTAYGGAAAAGL
jgi:predicted ribosomally synthesized peptide with nif11-like leader